MHAFGGKVLARGRDVLGRDANACPALDRCAPVVAPARRDDEPATADSQVDRLIESVEAVLEQYVASRHAQVGGTILHVSRHVGGAYDDDRSAGTLGRNDQLA